MVVEDAPRGEAVSDELKVLHTIDGFISLRIVENGHIFDLQERDGDGWRFTEPYDYGSTLLDELARLASENAELRKAASEAECTHEWNEYHDPAEPNERSERCAKCSATRVGTWAPCPNCGEEYEVEHDKCLHAAVTNAARLAADNERLREVLAKAIEHVLLADIDPRDEAHGIIGDVVGEMRAALADAGYDLPAAEEAMRAEGRRR